MLKHRLIFGLAMIVGLLLLFYLDSRLDGIDLTGTVFQSIFLGRTYLPSGLLMLLAFLLIIPLVTLELCAIFRAENIEADPAMVALSGITGCTLIYAMPENLSSQTTMAIFASLMGVLFLATLVKYSWNKRIQGAVAVGGVTMLAFIYMGIFPGFYLATRRWHSPWVVAAIILVTKSCDIGAYFTGRTIGRHKLIPWLSPGKTWEGLFGGVILSALVAGGVAMLANRWGLAGVYGRVNDRRTFIAFPFPISGAMAAGALLGLVGQFGDLTASLFKRDAGIKDSGNTIPGFGGLLDVVDSPIVVAPLAYWLLVLAAVRSPEKGGGYSSGVRAWEWEYKGYRYFGVRILR